MSAASSALMECPDVQIELDSAFETCDHALRGFASPFNEFLWSPQNRNNLQQTVVDGVGKVKNVVVRYDQPILPSAVQTGTVSEDINCTATTQRGDLTASYTIDEDAVLYIEEKMRWNDWARTCRSNPEIITRKIMLMMRALREATYAKNATDFVSNAMWGEYSNIVTSDTASFNVTQATQELVVRTLRSGTTDEVSPFTMQTIQQALLQTNYCGAPFVVGGNTLHSYFQRMQSGCCANQGIDLSGIMAQFGIAVSWDKYLQSALGTPNLSIAILPGALQMLYYNHAEPFAPAANAAGVTIGTNYEEFVITDPVSGMPMNLTLNINCKDIHIFLSTNQKLVALPQDMYNPSDEMSGVRFVNKIRVTNS